MRSSTTFERFVTSTRCRSSPGRSAARVPADIAAQHPDKISRVVLLAPAYNRGAAAAPPAKMPPDGVPMNTQSRDEFYANWDRQAGCPDQYDRAAGEAVWSEMPRIRSGRVDVGTWRAARAADVGVGMDSGGGRKNDDPDADGCGGPRQAGAA